MIDSASKTALVVRSEVPAKSNYLEYREFLRRDFWYICAYCFIYEIEARGIAFEIDHYLPKTLFPELTNEYSNLIWSCQICNRNKRDYSPTPNQESDGLYILRPDREDPADYYEPQGERLSAKTKTGNFNIHKLMLNRQPLLAIRKRRQQLHQISEVIAFGLSQLSSLKLDRIKPRDRLRFDKERKTLIHQKKVIDGFIDDTLREMGRSDLIDLDPELASQKEALKEFMKQQGALMPDKIPRKSKKKPEPEP